MQGYDNYRHKKADILRLYLSGRDVGYITGQTGTPKIRIEHELAKAIEKDKTLESRHLRARYPKQRRALRYPGAVILIDPREQFRAVNEY